MEQILLDLNAGLMIINDEPFLIEYNVRMGDPECQTILPKLSSEIIDIFLACCEGKLNEVNIEWKNKKSLCIVVCANGYPEEFKKNIEIKNLTKINFNNQDFLFHAGTVNREGKIYSIGGRVLNFVSLSDNFLDAKKSILEKLKKLNWKRIL